MLERDAGTFQDQRSVERAQRARDRRVARRGIAGLSVNEIVVALNDLAVDALCVARGLVPDRLLTTNLVSR